MEVWLRFAASVSAQTQSAFLAMLLRAGQQPRLDGLVQGEPGVLVLTAADDWVAEVRQAVDLGALPLVVALGEEVEMIPPLMWRVLEAGALDLLCWHALPQTADEIVSRLRRRQEIQRVVDSARVRESAAGHSAAWMAALRSVVEAACFTQSPVLIGGETGTGKERLAHLVHDLGTSADSGRFVIVDCTTLNPDLFGSELFGHERGAFTGANTSRVGAFALAHRGTLFLDEIGELNIELQAQLLRVVQEKQYKAIGSDHWRASDFRLVCATHRDLNVAVAEGRFRSDLYHRIAGWRCTAPPLRERREDVLPLVQFFLHELDAGHDDHDMDTAVRQYLVAREYPGNVRELRQLVHRMWYRHAGPGPLTVGDVPEQERPSGGVVSWPDRSFEGVIRQAVECGIGLNEIGQWAKDTAVRVALEREGQNVQRAAARLRVSDRLLQIRKKERTVPGRAPSV